MSQTVSTEISWHVWVPVGSSSRITRRGILVFGWLSLVFISWRREVVELMGGREERVLERGRWGGLDVMFVVGL